MDAVVSVFMESGRVDPVVHCVDKSLTKQSLSDECDINKIIARFEKTGSVTHVAEKQAIYGDFTQIGDFHAAALAVQQAEEMFMALPAVVRQRFDNDPEQLMLFLQDEKNRKEGEDLGLLNRKPRDPKDSDLPANSEAPGGQPSAPAQGA